jgi:uncharacterized protein YjbI with pentapeptide repeats
MDTKTVGDRIAATRKKLSISQVQLAEQLFISPQAVGKWERGESLPDLITFARVAAILGVDLNYFSDDVPAKTDVTAIVAPPTTRELTPSPTNVPTQKRSWNMSGASWVDADFSGLKNAQEKFSGASIQRCKFVGSDLRGFILNGNHIDTCDFSEADLIDGQIHKSSLHKTAFSNSKLNGAELSESSVDGCDFSGADLTDAHIKTSSFQKNTLTNAILTRTIFTEAAFSDLVFGGTLEDCAFDNCGFAKVTFQNATLLNTFFKGRSLKKLRFIDCQADRISYEFLKNGKADLSGVTLLNT